MSRERAVSIANGYVFEDIGVGVRMPVCLRTFPSPQRPDRRLGQPNLQRVSRVLSPGVKELRREADTTTK
jgi:hypothetical protein